VKRELPEICYHPLQSNEELAEAQAESLERQIYALEKQQQAKHERKAKRVGDTQMRVLRTSQAAKYIGISEWKLRQMVYSGEIEVIRGKYWTFDIQSLDHWIELNREKCL
jgi:hypothetical protein